MEKRAFFSRRRVAGTYPSVDVSKVASYSRISGGFVRNLANATVCKMLWLLVHYGKRYHKEKACFIVPRAALYD